MKKQLTVREAAQLMGCSERHIRSLIAEGEILAVEVDCAANGQKQYSIPVETLRGELKDKVFAQRMKAAAKRAPKVALPEPKPLDTYSADQREQIAFWIGICREWAAVRDCAENKTLAREKFRTMVQYRDAAKLAAYGIQRLTDSILYRKFAAWKNNDYDGLTERRGGHNRGQSSIDDRLFDLFLWYWLDDRKPTVKSCYDTLKMALSAFSEEFEGVSLPSEMAFRRRIKSDLSVALVTLGREGEKAYADRCMPYADRLYDNIESNDYWIGDTHTLDFLVRKADGGEGNVRLYLCAWQDARSGMLVGWYISDTLSSDTVLMALRHGIERCGVPKNIYVDNGREYLCYDVGGKGHRARKSDKEKFTPPPVLERLGVEMTNALVRNAKAKPIERTFGTIKNQISRLMATYCGGNVLEKPESLKKYLRDGKVPLGGEIRLVMDALIDSEYNNGAYGGKVTRDHGKPRAQIWKDNLHEIRRATEGDLALMLMHSRRAQKISRNGVHLTLHNEKLWYYSAEIAAHMGKQVYVRYDPAAIESVRVYLAETDEYLATVPMARDLMLLFGAEDPEAIGKAMQLQRNVKKADVRKLREIRESVPEHIRLDLLDWRIRKARELDRGELLNTDDVPITMIRAQEKEYGKRLPQSGVVIDIHKIVQGL